MQLGDFGELDPHKDWFGLEDYAEGLVHTTADPAGERHQLIRAGAARNVDYPECVALAERDVSISKSTREAASFDQPTCGEPNSATNEPVRNRVGWQTKTTAETVELDFVALGVLKEGSCAPSLRIVRVVDHRFPASKLENRLRDVSGTVSIRIGFDGAAQVLLQLDVDRFVTSPELESKSCSSDHESRWKLALERRVAVAEADVGRRQIEHRRGSEVHGSDRRHDVSKFVAVRADALDDGAANGPRDAHHRLKTVPSRARRVVGDALPIRGAIQPHDAVGVRSYGRRLAQSGAQCEHRRAKPGIRDQNVAAASEHQTDVRRKLTCKSELLKGLARLDLQNVRATTDTKRRVASQGLGGQQAHPTMMPPARWREAVRGSGFLVATSCGAAGRRLMLIEVRHG